MKTLASGLVGAALASATLLCASALSPNSETQLGRDPGPPTRRSSSPQSSSADTPPGLNRGRVVMGFSVLSGGIPVLGGLTANTPVTIRDVSGKWIEIDYPTQRSGPVWINTDLVVSFRVER